MSKTAMDEFIQYCMENAENVESQCGNKMVVVDYELMRDEFERLLEKEKQQIIEAYHEGRMPQQALTKAEQYFKNKYNK